MARGRRRGRRTGRRRRRQPVFDRVVIRGGRPRCPGGGHASKRRSFRSSGPRRRHERRGGVRASAPRSPPPSAHAQRCRTPRGSDVAATVLDRRCSGGPSTGGVGSDSTPVRPCCFTKHPAAPAYNAIRDGLPFRLFPSPVRRSFLPWPAYVAHGEYRTGRGLADSDRGYWDVAPGRRCRREPSTAHVFHAPSTGPVLGSGTPLRRPGLSASLASVTSVHPLGSGRSRIVGAPSAERIGVRC